MNLELLAVITAVASIASHYGDAITSYIGEFKDGVTEANSTFLAKWFTKSAFRLLGLSPLPYIAYGVAAMVYGGNSGMVAAVVFNAVNLISAGIGIEMTIHNYKINKAAEAKKVASAAASKK